MALKVIQTGIEGLKVISPQVFKDPRGYFVETFRSELYREAGIADTFVQENQSYSLKGVLRGLHAQIKKPQAKLVRVAAGCVLDVAVDARPDSATYGQWFSVELSGDNQKQFYVPRGCLHGFYVLSDFAIVNYLCSDVFDPTDPFAVMWNDPQLGITWNTSDPILSDKDRKNLSWEEAKRQIENK